MIERLEKNQLKSEKVPFVNPLDQENGRIPSWAKISHEFDLDELPRGQKKLWRAYYRAQRFFAQGRRKKGRRLMKALDNLAHFSQFEEENYNALGSLARRVRGKKF